MIRMREISGSEKLGGSKGRRRLGERRRSEWREVRKEERAKRVEVENDYFEREKRVELLGVYDHVRALVDSPPPPLHD